MEKRQQLEAIDKMLRELEDVKNSQESLLKKIAQIEAENMNVGVGLLEKELPDVHEQADAGIDRLSQLLDKFQQHREDFAKKHKLDVAEV
ncbi:MAG: hypothetical protein ABI861_08505 [Panacibacter sp.]